MTYNIDATVFVYRHCETREIRALYIDDARAMTGRADYEHIATLEPRAWIEAHYDDAEKEREACAKVCDSLASPSRLSDPSRSWITEHWIALQPSEQGAKHDDPSI